MQKILLRLHGEDGGQALAADRKERTAGASLLNQVIVAKYADHLPLHRQEKNLQRFGVELSDHVRLDAATVRTGILTSEA